MRSMSHPQASDSQRGRDRLTASSAGRNFQERSTAGSAGEGTGRQLWYFHEPVWQDLRLLVSFGVGLACVHVAETWRGGVRSDALEDLPLGSTARLKMYPFAL